MPSYLAYPLILAAILILTPSLLKVGSDQKQSAKKKLRNLFFLLLMLQFTTGFFNWESFALTDGRTGMQLALSYSNSYLLTFFIITVVQIIVLLFKRYPTDLAVIILNGLNTLVFFVGTIRVSNFLGKQIVSAFSLVAIFAVLIGNVVGLLLVNRDTNLLAKYPWSSAYIRNAKRHKSKGPTRMQTILLWIAYAILIGIILIAIFAKST